MKKFAKLYEFPDIGQVLVVLGTTEEGGPCVAITARPDGMGCCTVRPIFNHKDRTNEENTALAEQCFDAATEQVAYAMGQSLMATAKECMA